MTSSEEPYADTRDMYAVHTLFRREFALMPALVRGVTDRDEERAEIVADHIELLNRVLHHHHRAEEKHLWPKLLDRGSKDIASIVHVMEGQHENLETMISEVDWAARSWRTSAAPETGEALAGALDRMISLLNDHMGMEEVYILPIVEKYITAAEWDRMVREGAAETPRENVPLIFGMVMYEGDPEVIRQILSQMPPEMRLAMKEQASRAFASHSERVHGTATPPRIKRSAA
jgi:hemerythrin-like domain-containing protein